MNELNLFSYSPTIFMFYYSVIFTSCIDIEYVYLIISQEGYWIHLENIFILSTNIHFAEILREIMFYNYTSFKKDKNLNPNMK